MSKILKSDKTSYTGDDLAKTEVVELFIKAINEMEEWSDDGNGYDVSISIESYIRED